jgi:putative ABC transport system substrate-binding protein
MAARGARALGGTSALDRGIVVDPRERSAWARTHALEQALAKLGWTVGRNLAIDYRWGVTDLEKGRFAIAQVLRLSPDVLFINGGPGLTAGQQLARTVPIVFTGVSEPVERGFVASMGRPGGNTTGFTNLETTMGGKFIELLKEIAPRAARVTALFNPTSSFAVLFFRSAVAAGQKLGIDVVEAHVRDTLRPSPRRHYREAI